MDKEFKLFMKNKGVSIDASLFDLKFVEPQSFSQYKEIEIHAARASVFSGLEGTSYLSRRFMMEKYLGLTEDEILKLIKGGKFKTSSQEPIPTKLVQVYAECLVPAITRMINLSLQDGIVPSKFKHAVVTPILKKAKHVCRKTLQL